MTNTPITKSLQLEDGRTISIETGKLARQADGSAVVRMGDTMLIATVVSKKEAAENVDFLPLSVDYQEKYAAAGRFPGGFFKREARPSEHEILISRLVDRALRPLFPSDYHAETQVIISLISAEKNVLPDALACLAASAALMVSDIPFNGPISEVRVARIDGKLIINPSIDQMGNAEIDLMIGASIDNIVMVEGEMKEVSEKDMVDALQFAHQEIKKQCELQIELSKMVDKAKNKRIYCHENNDDNLFADIKSAVETKIAETVRQHIADKHKRAELFEAIKLEYIERLSEEDKAVKIPLINRYYHDIHKEIVRKITVEDKIRLDGRQLEEIRPIWCEIDYLPAAHGSAIFTRGETQSLTTVTLGTKLDEQVIDGAVIEGSNNFILHYNFPPFSTGEVKMMRATSRREIGHGNLALRALKPVIPSSPENPYTIRVVSDILESNGSSSMATVCAGTLALMDAGVKIMKPVSGIAMGLITDKESGKFAVLSDILGDEDHLGDMDFKVTGTKDGITACQMDIKVDGLSTEILMQALEQAKKGRLFILDKITQTIAQPREDYKPHAPRIEKMTILKEFIGAVIGPGGKIIQEIQRETDTTIVIEEAGDLGLIEIASNDKASIEKAKQRIQLIVAIPEVNEVYMGTVKQITAFGAFVEFLPGKDGLLHISEIDHRHIKDVNEVLKIGDQVKVKLIEVDKKTGKFRLSRKVLFPKPERTENSE